MYNLIYVKRSFSVDNECNDLLTKVIDFDCDIYYDIGSGGCKLLCSFRKKMQSESSLMNIYDKYFKLYNIEKKNRENEKSIVRKVIEFFITKKEFEKHIIIDNTNYIDSIYHNNIYLLLEKSNTFFSETFYNLYKFKCNMNMYSEKLSCTCFSKILLTSDEMSNIKINRTEYMVFINIDKNGDNETNVLFPEFNTRIKIEHNDTLFYTTYEHVRIMNKQSQYKNLMIFIN